MQVFARNVLRQAEKGMRPRGAGMRTQGARELPAEGCRKGPRKTGASEKTLKRQGLDEAQDLLRGLLGEDVILY